MKQLIYKYNFPPDEVKIKFKGKIIAHYKPWELLQADSKVTLDNQPLLTLPVDIESLTKMIGIKDLDVIIKNNRDDWLFIVKKKNTKKRHSINGWINLNDFDEYVKED